MNSGKSRIVWSSKDSALTLPARTWLEIKNNTFDEDYCGCGLPHHLLLPKGTLEGKIYDLFVMLTRGEDDAVEDDSTVEPACLSKPIWCVNYPKKYEDAKPMGYPFDRQPYSVKDGNSTRKVKDLEEYITGIPNMHVIQVIKYYETQSQH